VSGERYDRLHAGDRAQDHRTPGERDRDRVLYTSALRRLGAVTQVVSPTDGILSHTRLTHTLEVSQIGRRIAERLNREEESRVKKIGGIDPDIVETAALIHDLGHPPFGHAVEKELDCLVIAAGVADGFEGNPQSFRIVTKLATRNAKISGLNLTRATLNASLKYPWTRATSGYRKRKWGAYGTEKKEFDWARELHDPGDESRSVEAELMDWADDVAYAVHDVEDFYRVGLIPLDRLSSDQEEVKRFVRTAVRYLTDEPRYQSQELRETIDALVEAFVRVVEPIPVLEPYRGTRRQRAGLRAFTAYWINTYVNAVTLVPDEPAGSRVKISDAARDQVDILKQLTRFYVITNPALETQQYGQRRVVRDLFSIYKDALDSNDDISVFPLSHREDIEAANGDEEAIRIVADLISSMTEPQLLRTHQRLIGIAPGSVTDVI
jgi:dGTPase